MAMEDECLDLNAKLALLGFCKVRGSPNTKIGRKYGPHFLNTIPFILKKKSVVLVLVMGD
jgi:hypothetical protein